MQHESVIGHCASDVLGIPLKVAFADTAAGTTLLTDAEQRRLESMKAPRAADWLRGRSALKQVLRRLCRNEDTSTIAFPNSHLSLTHGGGIAIAVGTDANDIIGLGVDFEPARPLNPEVSRFFLLENEQDWLDGVNASERSSHLRRLWTVKESVFKADPDNHESILMDYVLDTPGRLSAAAHIVHANGIREFTYFSFDRPDGTISVAACKTAEDRYA